MGQKKIDPLTLQVQIIEVRNKLIPHWQIIRKILPARWEARGLALPDHIRKSRRMAANIWKRKRSTSQQSIIHKHLVIYRSGFLTQTMTGIPEEHVSPNRWLWTLEQICPVPVLHCRKEKMNSSWSNFMVLPLFIPNTAHFPARAWMPVCASAVGMG